MFIKWVVVVREFFSKMNSNQAFVTGLLIIVLISVHFSAGTIVDHVKELIDCSDFKREAIDSRDYREKKASQEIKYKLTIDSIIGVIEAEKRIVERRNNKDIAREIDRNKYKLNSVNNITFWSRTKGLGLTENSSRVLFKVLVSTDENIEYMYSVGHPIFEGHEYLANVLTEKGFAVISSLENDNDLFIGKSKDFFNTYGDKSIVGTLIKNKGGDWYFLTITFNIEYPSDENPDLFNQIRLLTTYINKRL